MKNIQSLTSADEMIRFRTHNKHQISLGNPFVVAKSQLMQCLCIQAGNPQLPDHRHGHQYMHISIGGGVAEELQVANK